MVSSPHLEMVKKYQDYFDKNKEKILEDFFTFLKFQTISADPAHHKEMKNCSQWLEKKLEQAGFFVDVWNQEKNPILFAEHKTDKKNCPTILFYHHYDVQPVDPISLWDSDPFTPVIKNGEIYARGACDNKGQCFYTLCALKAFLDFGKKEGINIKVLIEGEEEVGSESIIRICEEKPKELAADYGLIVDLGVPSIYEPAITSGFRGIVTFSFECIGSKIDLHSGQMGGIAYNPLRALSEVLAKAWDEQGRVQIEGFYDGVCSKFTQDLYKMDLDPVIDELGINTLHKEKGFSSLESNWIRPTFEINGLCGGYYGPGFKTVIPAKATCKVSCRLVLGQDPEKIKKAVISFFKKHLPKGFELKVEASHGALAYMADSKTKFAELVKKSLENATGKKAGVILAGGTLPIATSLKEAVGGEVLGMGFGLEDDYIHAPNEHFGLDRLKLGFVTIGCVLELLAGEL